LFRFFGSFRASALFKKSLIYALDIGKIGQLEEHCLKVSLMGVANTQVFSFAAIDPTRGRVENLDSRVYLPHLGLTRRITRNTKFIVEGPKTARRPIKTVLIQLLQVEGDLAFGVKLGLFVSSAIREEGIDIEKEAQEESHNSP
jgi:hypothetical protein